MVIKCSRFLLFFLCLMLVKSEYVRYREYGNLETQIEIAKEISEMYEKLPYPETEEENDEFPLIMNSLLEKMLTETLFRDNWTTPSIEEKDACTLQLTKLDVFEKYMSDVSTVLKSMIHDVHYEHHHAAIHGRHRNKSIEHLRDRKEKIFTQTKVYLSKLNEHVLIEMADAKKTSGKIINSDPMKFQRDVNFIELERLFQSIITPKYIANGSCWDYCSDMNGPTFGESYYFKELSSTCEGTIRNCENALNAITCKSDTNSRRYESFGTFGRQIFSHEIETIKKSYLEEAYGNILDCPNENIEVWEPEVGLIVGGVCGMCLCICEENSHYSHKSTFIISSQLAEADIDRQMAVTGVRFVREGKIIYTQIKQGKIIQGGRIDPKTEEWKPIDPLDYSNVKSQMISTVDQTKNPYKDFIVVSSDLNSVDLNNVYCANDQVVIGIGLRLSEHEQNRNHIVLMIKCLTFGFMVGRYQTNDMDLVKPIFEKGVPTNELKIGELPPNKVKQIHKPDSTNSQYVKFQISGKDDAGQSVIPWFDAQNVSTERSFPLCAVGLYHRGAPHSGGFLAYQLFSMNYENLLGF